jgi:hypothetical protein
MLSLMHDSLSIMNSEIMTFMDRDTKKQSEFSETLTFREFGLKYYGKVEDFCRLHTRYLALLGVRDLARVPKPFGETSLFKGKEVKTNKQTRQ